MNNKLLSELSWWLVIIGSINWGLVGLAHLDLVASIFGPGFLGRLVYILVGLSSVYLIYQKFFAKKV